MSVQVTDRGRAAAQAVLAGVTAVDGELAAMLTPEQLAGLRAGLFALCDIRERMEAEGRSQAGGPDGSGPEPADPDSSA